MSSPSLSVQDASVILRGQFNPAIVTPGWLLAQELLGPKEALDVRSQVILNQVSQCHVSWLKGQVTEDQLALSTDEPVEFDRVRDMAAGILETLSHTPVGSMGFNRSFHFQMPSWEAWHSIGDLLVPKEHWIDMLTLPGTENVSVQGTRTDEFAGRVLVSVQPSRLVKAGIYVSVNDHYVLERVESQPQTRSFSTTDDYPTVVEPSAERIEIAVQILRKKWPNSIEQAESIATKIANLSKG